MKTSQIRHVTVCFETCIVVTRNIQWEVTLACSALRASYTVRINPKKHSRSPEITGRSKQIDQRDSVLETSRSPLIIITVETCLFLNRAFKDFLPNCFGGKHQVGIYSQFTWILQWPQELSLKHTLFFKQCMQIYKKKGKKPCNSTAHAVFH